MAKLVLTKRPSLRAPYLIAGFGGWPNGGNVSTDTVYFLQSTLKAEQIGEITSDDLYIHSSPTLASRPITVIREGVLESLRFPANTLFACQRLGAEHDLLLLQGIEPDLHWQQFADAIVECLQTFIEGISLWGGAPSYVQGSYPRLTQAMLQFLSQLWHLPLDLEEIEEQAIDLEATLHEQIDTNPELADYIRRLEQVYDQAEGPQPDMNTDAIVDEIQQFLRRRRDNPLGNDL